MKDQIRLIRPYLDFSAVEADFREIFESGIFTKGQHTEALRAELATYVGTSHAFLTTSATTALSTSLKILGIRAGDEVVVSDFSFPATANVVEDLGAKPVFADVSLESFNMLSEELSRKISSKTKAVIFVDVFGNPSGIHTARAVCDARGIPLIEDAACAIGSSERGLRCGAIADLTCFSFHPRKLLTAGEGGAITTSRADLAERLAIKLNHGAVAGAITSEFVDYGYNFRLTELQAAMVRKQLPGLDQICLERNETYRRYRERLEPLGFKSQKIGADARYNVQSAVFRVPDGWDRDSLIRFLKEKNIESTIGTYCQSGTPYYSRKYSDVQPNSLLLQQTTLTLPCYRGVPESAICNQIARFKP